MDKQVIAIGGGGFGRNPGLGVIEKYILDQSKKRIQIYVLFPLRQVMMNHIKLAIIQLSVNSNVTQLI